MPLSVVFKNIEDMTVDELIQEFAGTDTCGLALRRQARHCRAPDDGSIRQWYASALAGYLIEKHLVTEARACGWDKLENGELAGFEVLITSDKTAASS